MKTLNSIPESLTPNYACIDVHYQDDHAVAAGILFSNWNDEHDAQQIVTGIKQIKPYIPGKFYLRELPCILRVLNKIKVTLDAVVIDGYVWLGDNSPGVGAHLYHALGGKITVIGVAKSKFKGAEHAQKVLRGKSRQPLYITSAGIDPGVAVQHIQQMHGKFRVPTLLRKVDRLSRCEV